MIPHEISIRAETRVKDLLLSGSRCRYGLVREISIESSPEANHAIVQLLAFVQHHVEQLTIRHATRYYDVPIRYHDSIGAKLRYFGCGLGFTALSSLIIDLTPHNLLNQIANILVLTPRLRELSISSDGDCSDDCECCGACEFENSAGRMELFDLQRLTMEYEVDDSRIIPTYPAIIMAATRDLKFLQIHEVDCLGFGNGGGEIA